MCFRFQLPDSTLGELARYTVEIDARVSIGFKNLGRVRNYLDIVETAQLEEVSLVWTPCQKNTFARFCSPTQPLQDVCNNGQLYVDGAFDSMMRKIKHVQKTL